MFDAMRALSGRDVVCFSNDWDGDPLSKTHVMRILARDNRILWVDSLGNRSARAPRHDATRVARKQCAAAAGLREGAGGLNVVNGRPHARR